jgi:hypothetical protein
MKPFLLGLTLLEELETDIRADEVDEHTCEVHDKFSREQTTRILLKEIM